MLYNEEAQRIIKIIEKKYYINWDDKDALAKITSLTLWNNNINDISVLGELENLIDLDLRHNQITDISVIGKLKKLIDLDLSINRIVDISILKELTNLSYVKLSDNSIADISVFGKLTNLIEIDLSCNNIINISVLKRLTSLQKVSLYENKITDISIIGGLKNLTNADLRSNQIKKLPKKFFNTKLHINLEDNFKEGILLKDNPIEEPPIEIISQDKKTILKYFEDLETQGRGKLNEAKLIIVGEPEAGKSTFMECLLNGKYKLDCKKKSTLGIDVKPWKFPHPKEKNRELRANIWDFGGQQIQYMTHQFFLTPDSLYVLVTANDRNESTNFPYWFKIISLLGEVNNRYSPVIVIKNKKNNEFHFDFDEAYYRKLYPNLQIEVREVNLSNRQSDFEATKEKIIEMISKLPLVNDDRPAKWSIIRDNLERKKENYIKFDEYAKVCIENNVNNKDSQILLSRYLHGIGSILHFINDINLRNFIILNPQWAVDAVYSVLADITISKNNGKFHQSKLDDIWHKYSFEERKNLLHLMTKDNFEICYPMSNQTDVYIAPQLLPNTKPRYSFDSTENLKFRFKYKFMPDGIITRLIVRLSEYINDELVWKKGAVFTDDGCKAQVVEEDNQDGLKIIDINVNGDMHKRKFLLHIIRKEIKSIHNKWFKNIESNEMIPCNCDVCKTSENPIFFEYLELEQYQKEGITEINCKNGRIKPVNVSLMIEGVFLRTEIQQTQQYIENYFERGDNMKINKSVVVNGSNTGVINTGNSNTITQTITTTNSNLKELLEDFKDEANKVIEALPEDKKDEFKDDADTFIEKAQENKFDKYFKVSKNGLLEAAEAVGEVGVKLIKYIPKILNELEN